MLRSENSGLRQSLVRHNVGNNIPQFPPDLSTYFLTALTSPSKGPVTILKTEKPSLTIELIRFSVPMPQWPCPRNEKAPPFPGYPSGLYVGDRSPQLPHPPQPAHFRIQTSSPLATHGTSQGYPRRAPRTALSTSQTNPTALQPSAPKQSSPLDEALSVRLRLLMSRARTGRLICRASAGSGAL